MLPTPIRPKRAVDYQGFVVSCGLLVRARKRLITVSVNARRGIPFCSISSLAIKTTKTTEHERTMRNLIQSFAQCNSTALLRSDDNANRNEPPI
jgi:hypothetical protein